MFVSNRPLPRFTFKKKLNKITYTMNISLDTICKETGISECTDWHMRIGVWSVLGLKFPGPVRIDLPRYFLMKSQLGPNQMHEMRRDWFDDGFYDVCSWGGCRKKTESHLISETREWTPWCNCSPWLEKQQQIKNEEIACRSAYRISFSSLKVAFLLFEESCRARTHNILTICFVK